MLTASPSRQALSVWPLFMAVGLLMLGNGLQSSLVGLRGSLEGFTTATIGVVMSGYFVGFLAGSVATPLMVQQVGHVRVYAGLASLTSAATLAHLVVVSPPAWFVFRLLTGICLAGLYVVAESWLNGASSSTTRGRLLAIYMVVVTGGLAFGQLLLTASDPGGFVLFLVASVLVSLAVVPISLVRFPAPPIAELGAVPYRRIMSLAPIGLVGAVVTGTANGAILGMGAVWGAESGLSVGRIAVLLTLSLVGGMTLQWPLGALSDRVSRRKVIFGTTSVAALLAVWMATLDPTSPLVPVAVFLLGGFSFPMYSLSGSHVNDLVGPELAVGASSAILLANGVGSIAGPAGASFVMTAIGPTGLWISIAVVHGALGLYAARALLTRPFVPAPFKRHFVHYPARSAGLSWAVRPTDRSKRTKPRQAQRPPGRTPVGSGRRRRR